MNYRIVSKHLGRIALALGVTMLPALICAFLLGETRAEGAFVTSILSCLAVAIGSWAIGRNCSDTMYQREAIALVGFSWILVTVLGALPFLFSGVLTSPIDAFFESMSGFTTTGATVIQDIEAAPGSILFWRSFTQWLGGLGIVLLFVAVLPHLGAEGKQLFNLEVSGIGHPTMRPHIRDSANLLLRLYLGLSIGCVCMLMLTGLDFYDSLCHMFSAIATGGFSPKQSSIAFFDNALVEIVLIAFMIIGAVNFRLMLPLFRGDWRSLWKDAEWRIYMCILIGATALVALNLSGFSLSGGGVSATAPNESLLYEGYAADPPPKYPVGDSFRKAAFQVTSILTGTGYVTDDYDRWPNFCLITLIVLMIIGGCAGSTAGGFKIIRVLIILKMTYWRLEALFRPKTIRAVRVNDVVIDKEVQNQIGGFLALYIFSFVLGILVMASFGLPFQTAISSVIATLNNVGPGLALVGPTLDYSLLPYGAKAFLSFLMVLGRLELFTIWALLMPSFWRGSWA